MLDGQTLVSTSIRGFRMLFHYTRDDAVAAKTLLCTGQDPSFSGAEASLVLLYNSNDAISAENLPVIGQNLLVPTAEADKFAFGILPGCQIVNLPDLNFTDHKISATIASALEMFDVDSDQVLTYRRYVERTDRCMGFSSDLIGMIAPFIPHWQTSYRRITCPIPDCNAGPLASSLGLEAFCDRLRSTRDSPCASGQMAWLLEQSESVSNRLANFADWVNPEAVPLVIHTLNVLRRCFESTTSYFLKLEKTYKEGPTCFRYKDLVAAHLSMSIKCYPAVDGDEKGASKKPDQLKDCSHT